VRVRRRGPRRCDGKPRARPIATMVPPRSLLLGLLLGLLAAAPESRVAALRVVFSPPVQCNKTGPCPPHLLSSSTGGSGGTSGASLTEPPLPLAPPPPPPIGSACTVTELLGCFDLKSLGFVATMHDRNKTFDQSESLHHCSHHRVATAVRFAPPPTDRPTD
jgi:hypothetical protein